LKGDQQKSSSHKQMHCYPVSEINKKIIGQILNESNDNVLS